MSFYCPEHEYSPPDNSGFAFCPQCELKTTRALPYLEKVVPLYDERDNYNPKGRDVNPMFAAGWNAAIDAMNSPLVNGCEHQIVRTAASDVHVLRCIDCDVVATESAFANFRKGEIGTGPSKDAGLRKEVLNQKKT